jgi:hypothetical protein
MLVSCDKVVELVMLKTYDIKPCPSSAVVVASTFAIQHSEDRGRDTHQTSAQDAQCDASSVSLDIFIYLPAPQSGPKLRVYHYAKYPSVDAEGEIIESHCWLR